MATKKAVEKVEEVEALVVNGIAVPEPFAALWRHLGEYAPTVMGEPEYGVQEENTGRAVMRFGRGWFIDIDGKAEALGFAAAPHLA